MAYVGNVPAVAYTNTVKDSFSGDGSTVAFTLSLPTTTNNVRVVVENVIQDPTVAYGVSGTTLTFTSAPPSGTNNIYVVHLGPAVQTVQPPTQLSGNFTLTGDLTQTGDYTLTGAASISGQLDTASILPTADATSVLGGASNRYTNLFLSGGVYLGGTGAANLLDDYEEGTWTPVDGSGAGLTFTVNDARYTKIGRMVQCYAQVNYPSTADINQAGIGGLPFTVASTNNFSYGAFTVYTNYDFALWLSSNGGTLSLAHNLAGNTVTNANVSGKQFRLVWIYDT